MEVKKRTQIRLNNPFPMIYWIFLSLCLLISLSLSLSLSLSAAVRVSVSIWGRRRCLSFEVTEPCKTLELFSTDSNPLSFTGLRFSPGFANTVFMEFQNMFYMKIWSKICLYGVQNMFYMKIWSKICLYGVQNMFYMKIWVKICLYGVQNMFYMKIWAKICLYGVPKYVLYEELCQNMSLWSSKIYFIGKNCARERKETTNKALCIHSCTKISVFRHQ